MVKIGQIIKRGRLLLFFAVLLFLTFTLLLITRSINQSQKIPSKANTSLEEEVTVKGEWKVKKSSFMVDSGLTGNLNVLVNENVRFYRSGRSNIKVESNFGGGVVRHISLEKGSYYTIHVPVFIDKGRVRLNLVDSQTGKSIHIYSKKENKWEELNYILDPKDRFYPDTLFVEALGGVFYLDDEGVEIVKGNSTESSTLHCAQVPHPKASKIMVTAVVDESNAIVEQCKFFESCTEHTNPPSCQFNENWVDEVGFPTREVLYETYRCKAGMDLDFIRNPGGSLGQIVRLVRSAGFCPNTIDLKEAVGSIYPELSETEISSIAQGLIEGHEDYFEMGSLAVDAVGVIDGSKLLVEGGPKLLSILRHPEEIVRTGRLTIGRISEFISALRSSPQEVLPFVNILPGVEDSYVLAEGGRSTPVFSSGRLVLGVGRGRSVVELGGDYQTWTDEALDIVARNGGYRIPKDRIIITPQIDELIKILEEATGGFVSFNPPGAVYIAEGADTGGGMIVITAEKLAPDVNPDPFKTVLEEATHATQDHNGFSALLDNHGFEKGVKKAVEEGSADWFVAINTDGLVRESYKSDAEAFFIFEKELANAVSLADGITFEEAQAIVRQALIKAVIQGEPSDIERIYNQYRQGAFASGEDFWDDLYLLFRDLSSQSDDGRYMSLAKLSDVLIEPAYAAYPVEEEWSGDSILETGTITALEYMREKGLSESVGDYPFELFVKLGVLVDSLKRSNQLSMSTIDQLNNDHIGLLLKQNQVEPVVYVPVNIERQRQPISQTPLPPRSSAVTLSGKVYCGNEQRLVPNATVDLLKGGWNSSNRVVSANTDGEGRFSLQFMPQDDSVGYILTARKGGSVHQSSYQCMMIDENTFCTTAAEGENIDSYAACDREGNCHCTSDPQLAMCSANSFNDDAPRALNFNRQNITFILNQCPQDSAPPGGQCGQIQPPRIETRLLQRRANSDENFSSDLLQLGVNDVVEYKVNLTNRSGSPNDFNAIFNISASDEHVSQEMQADLDQDGNITIMDWLKAIDRYGEVVQTASLETRIDALTLSDILSNFGEPVSSVQTEEEKGWEVVIPPRCDSWQETDDGFVCGLFRGGHGNRGMQEGESKDYVFQIRIKREGNYKARMLVKKNSYVNPSGCCGTKETCWNNQMLVRDESNAWGRDFPCVNSYCAQEPFEFYSGNLETHVGSQ